MTLDDTEIIKTAIGWVATIGATLTGTVGYLFFQVVSLTRKVGRMESEIQEYKNDIAEYKNCPIPQCYFRHRKLVREQTQTITTSNPQTA
jgi:hypothetical protein